MTFFLHSISFVNLNIVHWVCTKFPCVANLQLFHCDMQQKRKTNVLIDMQFFNNVFEPNNSYTWFHIACYRIPNYFLSMILICLLNAPNVVTIKTEVKMNAIMILTLIRNPLLIIKVILSILFCTTLYVVWVLDQRIMMIGSSSQPLRIKWDKERSSPQIGGIHAMYITIPI